MTVSRRDLLLAGGGAVGIALLGAGAYEIFKPASYPPTPYDDLLNLLSSREEAVKAGSLMTGIPGDAAALAGELRGRIQGASLADTALRELNEGKLHIADGWVVPESVALLCALAARVKAA